MKHYRFFIIFLLCIGILGFLNGCSKSNDEKNFFYSSSNCNEVKRDCLRQCRSEGKSQAICLSECEKVRGMCAAIKAKGCLQDCNLQYGKGTQSAEQCKKRCAQQ